MQPIVFKVLTLILGLMKQLLKSTKLKVSSGNTLSLQRPTIHTLLGLVSHVMFYLSASDFPILVLHPCLCSHWFAATVDIDKQDEAISNTEVAFQYIAKTYLE